MILLGVILVFCIAPVLLIVLALAWLWLGQKILGCIFGG